MNILNNIERLSIVLLLCKNSNIHRFLSNLTPSHFDDPISGLAYKIIRDYFYKYEKLITPKNFIVIAKSENIDVSFLSSIIKIYNTIKKEPIEFYCDAVSKDLRTKILTQAVNDSYKLVLDGEEDKIEGLIRNAISSSAEFDYGINYYDDIDRRYNSVENRYKTGYSQLDYLLGGGWQKKCAYAIMGASGFGKSIFLSNFAISQSLMNRNTIYFSLELPEESITSRIDSIILRKEFDIGKINELSDKLKKIKDNTLNGKGTLFIKSMPDGYTNMAHLRNYVDNLVSKTGFIPEVIVLDYVTIVEPINNTNAPRHEKIGTAVREFHGWMSTDNLIGLTAMQQRRIGKEQDRDDTDEMEIGDSYEAVRPLDGLFGIVQTPQDKMAVQPTIHLKSLKNRQGPTQKRISFNIHYEQMRIEEVPIVKT